jgi:YqjK-like protein
MINRSEPPAERRARLVAKAAAQRVALAYQMEPWRARLNVADQGVAVARIAGRHPLLLAGAAALLVAWQPRRAVKWLQYGWMGWQLVRQLRAQPGTAPFRFDFKKII